MNQTTFAILHRLVHGVAIPVLQRSGPVEPAFLTGYQRLTRRPPRMTDLPCPVVAGDLQVWYDPSVPSFTVRGVAMGTYERPTVALVERLLGAGMSVVDVGAHIGYYTLLASSMVGPSGSVWSFEPDPATRVFLQRNVAANGFDDRVEVIGKAVGAMEATLPLFRHNADSGSSSLLRRPAGGVAPVEVEVTTLDAWAVSEGWPRVDLMKIDVEGGEAGVLSGGAELAERNPDMSIILELNTEASGDAEDGGSPLFAQLRELGFDRIFVVHGRRLQPVEGRADEARLARRSRWVPLNLYCPRGRAAEDVGSS